MIELVTKPVEEDGDVSNEVKPEMIDIFSIDGTVYQMEDRVRVDLSIRYIFMIREYNVDYAQQWLFEQLLGKDALLALINWKDIDLASYQKVMSLTRQIAFGETVVNMGKALRQPKKSTTRKTSNG